MVTVCMNQIWEKLAWWLKNTTLRTDRPDSVLLTCVSLTKFFYPPDCLLMWKRAMAVHWAHYSLLAKVALGPFVFSAILSSVQAFLSRLMKYYIWLWTVHYFGQSFCSAAETRTYAEIVRGCYNLLPVYKEVSPFLHFLHLPPRDEKEGRGWKCTPGNTCVSVWLFLPLPVLPREISPKAPKLAMAIVVQKISLYC